MLSFLFIVAELNTEKYWRDPFLPFCDAKQLSEFTVLDTEKNRDSIKNKVPPCFYLNL